VDKAPRDFPNDILNEIERMYFKIPELGNQEVSANEDCRPVVILTSNSEKHLPDAFLRRCVFYNIAFPDDKSLANIVINRIDNFKDDNNSPLLKDAISFFFQLRGNNVDLSKRPATAELIGWLDAMTKMGANVEVPLRNHHDKAYKALGVLVKNADDQDKARELLKNFIGL